MAKYIECPKMWGSPSLFMGGGISGCPDWQAQLVRELKDVDLVLVNPRRKVFDVSECGQHTASDPLGILDAAAV
jgi:hypothetical protein